MKIYKNIMNALQKREVLMKVKREMKCPLCSTSISPSNITIGDESEDNKCILEMKCGSCSSEFGGHAHFQESVTEYGKSLNASTRMKKTKEVDSSVTLDDLHSITDAMKHVTNLSEFFASSKK